MSGSLETRRPLPRALVTALALAGCVVLALAGYFVLVAPKRGAVAETKREVTAKEKELESLRSKAQAAQNAPEIRYADLYRLTKAMPDRVDMPDALLALNRIAEETGIAFIRVAPMPVVNLPSYQAVPIQLVFQGNFYDLTDFVYRVRNLVRVRDGELDASGRLFAVDSLEFGPPPLPDRFPTIRATLQVNAFVYGQASAPAAGAATATDTSATATTSTDTTATEPAPPPAGEAPEVSAAGATP
jgi:Tfp pilus assembly protein PilO